MKLYRLQVVEAIELSEEFRAVAERSRARMEAAAKGVATKRARTMEAVSGITIPVPEMEMGDLVGKACASYNARGGTFGPPATPDSAPDFLDRIMVNYLRHECTKYDAHLSSTRGRVGVGRAFEEVNKKVYDAITERYPRLADESRRQYQEKMRRRLYR
jgi:hypothetical protein